MNAANAKSAVRGRIEQRMKAFKWREEMAALFAGHGDDQPARANQRIAEQELQKAAELLSIENHLNGVSPE